MTTTQTPSSSSQAIDAVPERLSLSKQLSTIPLSSSVALQIYAEVRGQTERLCDPLQTEDYGVQPMADASPPKWHLAHTTWFFETFILKPFHTGYVAFNDKFEYLFNSYYNGVGEPFPRASRGFLSRPTVAQVYAYRRYVDDAIVDLLEGADHAEVLRRLVLGCHHEQQHQELLITDLKYNFGHNPLFPVYAEPLGPAPQLADMQFVSQPGGVVEIGAAPQTQSAVNSFSSFCFDNEQPQHSVMLADFALADRLVTNGEYAQFIAEGGYHQPEFWLAEGWTLQSQLKWQSPEYWYHKDGQWFEYRLDGLHPLDPNLPVTHVSAHEAFAYANWAGARLPTEFEFELATDISLQHSCGYLEGNTFHPMGDETTGSDTQETALSPYRQAFGHVWQWTASAYSPYPGFEPLPGTLGEYNGKFMSSQLVLRGASCVTAQSHARQTYRNFFYPGDRWQFTGIRLARNV